MSFVGLEVVYKPPIFLAHLWNYKLVLASIFQCRFYSEWWCKCVLPLRYCRLGITTILKA